MNSIAPSASCASASSTDRCDPAARDPSTLWPRCVPFPLEERCASWSAALRMLSPSPDTTSIGLPRIAMPLRSMSTSSTRYANTSVFVPLPDS